MFRHRKKSQGKRPDDHRDRDNSRVLDRYSDTDTLPATLPFRRESLPAGNFQYLKLTDGFNFVLTSDSGESPSSSHQLSSSPDPSSSPESPLTAEKRNNLKRHEAGRKQTKIKPVTDVLISDRGTDTQQEDSSFHQTEYVNIGSISRTDITSSTTETASNSLSQNVQEKPQKLSSGLPVISQTSELHSESEIMIKPSAKLPPATEHTEISRNPNDEPCAVLDVGQAGSSPGSGQKSKQKDNIKPAGDLTDNTRGADKGKKAEKLAKEKSSDKHEESGRGTSNIISECVVSLEGETHADKTRSLKFYSNDNNTTATESELAPSATKGPFDGDKEPNKSSGGESNYTREERGTCTSAASSPVLKLHSTKQEFRDTKQKLDTTEMSSTQSRFGQTDTESEDSSFRYVLPSGQSEGDDSVIQAAEISESVYENTDIGHDSTTDHSEPGKFEEFRNSVTGPRRKKNSKITGDVSDIEKRHTVADMFRLHRHNRSSKRESNEQPAVYRKLNDNGNTETDQTSTNPSETAHPISDPHPNPALSLQPPRPAISPRPKRPVALPKPRKRSAPQIYENWTINQAVTQIVDSNDEDDDDADEDCDNVSPVCSLDRHSATQGSKDSGLCVETHHTIVVTDDGKAYDGPDTQAATSTEQQQQQEEEGGRVIGEKIQDEGEEKRERDSMDPPCVSVLDEESAIYENTEVLPRPQNDGDSSAGTPDIPDSPDVGRLTPKMAARRHHDNHSLTSTASEEDHKHNFSMSGDSSFDEGHDEVDQVPLAPSARENMLKMRQLLVRGVLETEKTYLAILELLLHYKRTLEASCRTSQPVLSEEDIGSVFSNLQDLLDVHKLFVEGLQIMVDTWTPESTVGDVFMFLVEKFPEFGNYAKNYQTAVATIHRCSQDNHRFQDLAQQIVLTSTTREVTSLEDALFKPVQRLQRNTLVLYDLIKHTPKDHPDHETLQKALHLSQRNLENFDATLVVPRNNKGEQKGHLVKSSFLVQLVGGSRKLRYIFLFSDMLVCTKREQASRGGEVTFECKWFIPLNELQLDTKFTYQDDMKFSKRDEIEDLKKKLRSVKTEIKKELNKEETKDKQRPITSLVPSRTVEKLQRKANELEGQLILASPRLPFKVWHEAGKAHTFLMTTDYERQEWREQLSSLKPQAIAETDTFPPNAFGVQEMVNSVRGLPEINEIGSVLIETEEEVVYGTLNVTVHKLTGLSEPCDTYCCLEMDSYGHFFMKARTHISSRTIEPSWNADFELDLEGSQTLRVLCYKKGPDKKGDILLCRGALEITKAWLKGTFQEKIVTMNEYSLVMSVCYTATEKTLRRTPVRHTGTAVFGVHIGDCAPREGKTVPTLVTVCVQEVEKRGMKETGIYRVSGVTSDVQRLKKHFDKSLKVGVSSLNDVDIHTVTSLLKLYLRELPDPVFTEASYPNFLDALKLTDKEGKEKCMLSLFYNLPDINYYTAVYLLEHLLRISRYEADNKMSIHNLSTIFGPTLLAPAPEKMATNVTELMTLGAEHCMKQSQVIHYYLGLLARGASLRRSSAVVM